MAGRTLDLDKDLLIRDELGCQISDMYITWDAYRAERTALWQEIQEYVFATDTTVTSNAKLPWSNKTTIPKLCQIRDNIHANYMYRLFPNRKWLTYECDEEKDNSIQKKEAATSYMQWVVARRHFYNTVSKLVYDYIDYGNVFAMPEWVDETNKTPDTEQVGYVGPKVRRIAPTDIVFNPTAPDFDSSPKIIRSITSLGEVKELLLASSKTEEDRIAAEELFKYLREIRSKVSSSTGGNWTTKDRIYQVAGFGNFQDYLKSDMVEVLTFYGTIYDKHNDKLLKNVVIKVVDRHKVIYQGDNESSLGMPPIFHVGWRERPDILWAAGPLDNLIGMQYRIDHLENMKADCIDLNTYPIFKIKGYVEDFKWEPMERIYVGDDGDVDLLTPNVQAIQLDNQIGMYEAKMEEMAGSPREAMGFRSPGEKTKYEVQSLENASGRIFQAKIDCFERDLLEPLLNSMLDLARGNLNETTIRVFDDELKFQDFLSLNRHDITGSGRIIPIAARHFAEQAQLVQDITAFFGSPIGQDPMVNQHISGLKIARLIERLLELDQYDLVEPYIRLSEQADSQRMMQSHEESVAMETTTPNGFSPGDFDPDVAQEIPPPGGVDQGPTF